MFIRIEKGSSVPVSRQIADQITALALAGTLKPNDQLPSVRQLARELAVNQNTVLRVYERLAGEGLLDLRHGEGTFVAARPPKWRLQAQQQRFAEEFQEFARRGLQLGLRGDELHDLVAQAVSRADEAPVSAAVNE
ncbi:MAG TPA: GntR family transcriptional regulator [Pirellulales bacterium]|nr:GntR family transcriptional regulator [Pirellulales bacterium]